MIMLKYPGDLFKEPSVPAFSQLSMTVFECGL